jgi:glyoxylase-like metal-dependent hydrolase (beta-lactamase superfamily II)
MLFLQPLSTTIGHQVCSHHQSALATFYHHNHSFTKTERNIYYSILIVHCNFAIRTMAPTATIDSLYHLATGTWQYIVADANALSAVIIDPVLDLDAATQTITTTNADALISTIKAKGYNIVRILETHAHADHLTSSAYLQQVFAHTQNSRVQAAHLHRQMHHPSPADVRRQVRQTGQ